MGSHNRLCKTCGIIIFNKAKHSKYCKHCASKKQKELHNIITKNYYRKHPKYYKNYRKRH